VSELIGLRTSDLDAKVGCVRCIGKGDKERIVPVGKKALAIVEKTLPAVNAQGVKVDTDIAKVSVVGVGMRTHAGVAAKMFEVLGREGINIEMISTSEIKISVVIDAKYTELAMRVLHDAFIGNQGNV